MRAFTVTRARMRTSYGVASRRDWVRRLETISPRCYRPAAPGLPPSDHYSSVGFERANSLGGRPGGRGRNSLAKLDPQDLGRLKAKAILQYFWRQEPAQPDMATPRAAISE